MTAIGGNTQFAETVWARRRTGSPSHVIRYNEAHHPTGDLL